MYNLRLYEDLGCSFFTHLAVSVRYRDDWGDDGLDVVLPQVKLD